MVDGQTAALMAAAAFLLLAVWGFVAARSARGEVAGLRGRHEEARDACAKAESRCAAAQEAVGRLEAAAEALRRDHAETLRVVREEGAATLAAVRAEGAKTAERLRSVEEEFSRLGQAHAALLRERAERDASHERQVAQLRDIRKEMTDEFRSLASVTLRETGVQVSELSQQKLSELLGPVKEQVKGFQSELRQVHDQAKAERITLAEQIRLLHERTAEVSQDAANLAQALRGDKQRQGAWGEAQLENYLELMGFRRDVDFEVQPTQTAEDGDRLRPDVILRLPGERRLIIDSKVSLSAYADAIATEDPAERARLLQVHATNVMARVNELADREYHRHVDGSMDWVLLFMPIEGAVSAAWAEDGKIAEQAMRRGVALAYPTTLLLTLRTVRHLWDVEKRNKNAEAIAERAGRLHDKLAGFLDSFESVGRQIEGARNAHEKALGQLSKGRGNLVRQVEELRELGARTSKSLALRGEADDEPRILGLPGATDEPDPEVRPAE